MLMEEYEFRGKRLDNNQWTYGFYWFVHEHANPDLSRRHFIKSKNNGIDYEVDWTTVGQYTQLRDMYGTKLYTKDYIQLSNDYIGSGDKFIVEVDNGCYVVKSTQYIRYANKIGQRPLADLAGTSGHYELVGNSIDGPNERGRLE